ncbi:MAG: lysophospholipid acyltransferase family protein [Myxococcota bacterium]|nr:lysophospholipid acyltransferase family protein [Myxococcota bacterium]
MGKFWKRVAQGILWVIGWQPEGGKPVDSRFVLIAAPHTSNWDLPMLLVFAAYYEVRISWMGKHTLFRGPMGWAMRLLGGVPVRRDRRNNLVDQMAELFAERERLALVVPAEGTRSYAAHWKSGFYRIAEAAGVPIVTGFLDYGRKRGGFGPALHPSGDLKRDMDEIRDFYSDKEGRYPDLFGPIQLKEES